jgi:hypothetical protein
MVSASGGVMERRIARRGSRGRRGIDRGAFLPLALVALATLGAPVARAAEPHSIAVGPDRLELTLPVWPDLMATEETDDHVPAWWVGQVGESKAFLEVRLFPHGKYRLGEPHEVTDLALHYLQDPEYRGHPDFRFTSAQRVRGAFGFVPWGHLCSGPYPSAEKPAGEVIALGGVLPTHAYLVRLFATPALDASARADALAFLTTGVRGRSAVRDPAWTEAEATERLTKLVSDAKARKKWKAPVRTKHYIVFTDSGAGKLFAEKMEECYARIQKTFPFPEHEGERLMPVYLFKDKAGYERFCEHVLKSASLGRESKGHAWQDYYATYYDSPNDPVHVHEATHQIFDNRMGLSGGGSWFQEGVAEYMSTRPDERETYGKRASKQGKPIPFERFVQIPSLLSEPGIEGLDAYHQAACLIELLRDGWKTERFPEFLQAIGTMRRSYLVGIQEVVKRLYDTDLQGLEKEWVKYWTAKR